MASGRIRKRGTNRWELTWDIPRGVDGKRQRRYETVRGNKREAQARLTQIMESLRRGQYFEPSMMPLAQYLNQWLEAGARSWKPKTLAGHSWAVHTHIAPRLGTIPLARLTALDIQRFLGGRLDSGLSSQSVINIYASFRRALNQAVGWELLVRNVIDRVSPPRLVKRRIRTLTPDEVPVLLDAANGTDFHLPIHLAIYTGLRISEVVGLRWSDINMRDGSLTVNQNVVMIDGRPHRNEYPKTATSRRTIKLPEATTLLLRSYRERREADLALLGIDFGIETQVCIWSDGKLMRPDTLNNGYKRIRHRAGIDERVRFHDLRHTHATFLLEAGVPMHQVKDRLGHSSIQITVDTYGHLLPASDQNAASAFERIVS